MKVVILGCGRVGSTLARMLSREGHDVSIIDWKPEAFRRLGTRFKGQTIHGNGVDSDVLRHAGIENADAFVAVTNGDNTNIMSVQIAKVIFSVSTAVARIYDPIRAYAYRELGIDTICSTSIVAGLMEDFLLGKEFRAITAYCDLDTQFDA